MLARGSANQCKGSLKAVEDPPHPRNGSESFNEEFLSPDLRSK